MARHLRVPVEAIQKEIAGGHLHATKIAEYLRVRESDLNAFKSGSRTESRPVVVSAKADNPTLDAVPNFFHTWPNKRKEHFSDAREGVAVSGGTTYHVKLGFTNRASAGKRRRRSLILINRYPSVEFVSADTNEGGLMASIIRDRAGKHLPVGATVPPEYTDLRIGGYRDVVVGPGAPNGVAVICDQDDIQTMVRHALIRYRYREER